MGPPFRFHNRVGIDAGDVHDGAFTALNARTVQPWQVLARVARQGR